MVLPSDTKIGTMTLSIMAFSIMTLCIITLSIKTLNIIFSIITFGTMTFSLTIRKAFSQHEDTQYNHIQCLCRVLLC